MSIVLVIHNVRSCHNVGSLLRTSDGLGVKKVYFTGYTPWPAEDNDSRLPHIKKAANDKIHKTALGAENSVSWERVESLDDCLQKLKKLGYEVAALEQSKGSIKLADYKPTRKIALVVGPEVEGFSRDELKLADKILEIPMHGQKESLNVAVAGALALYHLSQP